MKVSTNFLYPDSLTRTWLKMICAKGRRSASPQNGLRVWNPSSVLLRMNAADKYWEYLMRTKPPCWGWFKDINGWIIPNFSAVIQCRERLLDISLQLSTLFMCGYVHHTKEKWRFCINNCQVSILIAVNRHINMVSKQENYYFYCMKDFFNINDIHRITGCRPPTAKNGKNS